MEAHNSGRPSHVLPVPRWTLIIHGIQMVLAIIILGLDAYGIRWIAYNALVFSLVAAILTLGVCIYIVGTSLFLHNLYNAYIVFGLHLLMVIFWVCDMGLVANLARIWAGPQCSYDDTWGYYSCAYRKRDIAFIEKREESTTYTAYYGALAAGAFFGALQFALWAVSTVITIIYINRQRSNPNPVTHAPPAYVDNNNQSVPLEQKFNQTAQPQAQPVYQQPQQQQYSAASTPQRQYSQPGYNQQQQFASTPAPYAQDPVNRQNTVSPVSQVGYGAPSQHTSELASPHHTGNYSSNPNVSELSTPQRTGAYNPNVSELSDRK